MEKEIKMGRYLDVAFFSSSAFLILFVLLSFTERDIKEISIISAVTAFCVGVIANAILKRTKLIKKRRNRSHADKKVKALIYADESDALKAVFGVLSKKYRLHDERKDAGRLYFRDGAKEIRYALVVIRKFKASPDDLLSVWREIRKKNSADKIVFAIPGKSDPDVKLMPIRLISPDVQILDKARLKKLVKKYDLELPETVKLSRIKLSVRIRAFINRKRALRYIACALLLLFNYLFFGKILYLIFASVLAFASVFSLVSQNEYEFLSD